jgi:hypothetical protein
MNLLQRLRYRRRHPIHNLLWRLGLLPRQHRHPQFTGDEWMLEWFNEAKDRGMIAEHVSLSQLLGVRAEQLDRKAGIPPGH